MSDYRQRKRSLVSIVLLFYLFTFLPSLAQRPVRGDCTPVASGDATEARSTVRQRLRTPQTDWDPTRVYKQLVILVSYSDTKFKIDHDITFYNSIFNEPGYNRGLGPGCLADYFREQSGGLFNIEFDVFGPYQVNYKAQPYTKPTADTHNYGADPMKAATKLMIDANPGHDFRQYDWNGDGQIEQVIYIFAGYGGNQTEASYGYVWPNTSSFTAAITTPDGVKLSNYTASAELWLNERSCGIGTIAHEFSHSLGLPDIYPNTSNSSYYSVCDEWDLMDGGNFTNYGWCPPYYTALERMLLGWLTPIELTTPVTVSGMAPVSEGGDVYIIRHKANEYLLLENRQRSRWDYCAPGQGLLITHVDYLASRWSGNTVNTQDGHFRFDIVHADNLDYEQWADIIDSDGMGAYAEPDLSRSRYLSTSTYPYADSDGTVNDQLSNTSVPASVMYNVNDDKTALLCQAVTGIQTAPDGTISFNFEGYLLPEDVRDVTFTPAADAPLYNLQGQRITRPRPGLYIQNGRKKVYHK